MAILIRASEAHLKYGWFPTEVARSDGEVQKVWALSNEWVDVRPVGYWEKTPSDWAEKISGMIARGNVFTTVRIPAGRGGVPYKKEKYLLLMDEEGAIEVRQYLGVLGQDKEKGGWLIYLI